MSSCLGYQNLREATPDPSSGRGMKAMDSASFFREAWFAHFGQVGRWQPRSFLATGYVVPQTLRAVLVTSSSLRHCSSEVSRLPAATDAKPHWVLSARFSRGINLAASS